MKHTVHVTFVVSVEVDDEDLKKEFGKSNKKLILKEAIGKANVGNPCDMTARIFESYQEEKKNVRRGLGSY